MVTLKFLVLPEALATHGTYKREFISGNGVNNGLLLLKQVEALVLFQLLLGSTAHRAHITVHLLVTRVGVGVVVTEDIHIGERLLADPTLERICRKLALQGL